MWLCVLLDASHTATTLFCYCQHWPDTLTTIIAVSSALFVCVLQARLLTGIGRYNEMVYVFDCFYHHERFNTLLVKGVSEVCLTTVFVVVLHLLYCAVECHIHTRYAAVCAVEFLLHTHDRQLFFRWNAYCTH